MMSLPKDNVVVVTGGCGLIGAAFIRAVADAGAIAVIADVASDRAAALRADLIAEDARRRIDAVTMDITEAESIDAVIEALLARHGRIDGLVNNAYPRNARYGRTLEDVSYADFVDNVGVHLGGYFLTSQRFLAPLRAGDGGTIVNMGSVYGVIAPRFGIYEGTPMTMPVEYAAIKAGVIHLTRYFAQYAKGSGLRVNCLSPGGVLDRQPEAFLDAYRARAASKGMLAPQDLTGALLFLLSPEARYVNGQNLIVDDGWTL